jgi:hypothetical protein
MSEPSLTTPSAGADYPGKMLGIVGLIVAILASAIGLIISAIAFTQSKRAGYKNMPALIGIIVGAVLLVITVISVIVGVAGASVYLTT